MNKTVAVLLVAIALVLALLAYAVGQTRAAPAAPVAGPAASLASLSAASKGQDVVLYLVFVDREGRDTTYAGNLSGSALVHGQLDWRLSRGFGAGDSAPLPDPLTGVSRPTLQIVIPASAWTRRPDAGAQLTLSLSAAPSGGAAFTANAATSFP